MSSIVRWQRSGINLPPSYHLYHRLEATVTVIHHAYARWRDDVYAPVPTLYGRRPAMVRGLDTHIEWCDSRSMHRPRIACHIREVNSWDTWRIGSRVDKTVRVSSLCHVRTPGLIELAVFPEQRSRLSRETLNVVIRNFLRRLSRRLLPAYRPGTLLRSNLGGYRPFQPTSTSGKDHSSLRTTSLEALFIWAKQHWRIC